MDRTHFGKYEVVELIGKGGFGQVFKGLDPDLKRPVAIKTCSLEEEGMRERFFKEAEIAARLQHPNITTVYDFGKVDGEPYMVQEYLAGEDLDQMIKRRDPISLASKLRFLLQVADGLRYAHSRGVVHRDVKPANIRVLEDGQVRIMDFGIARLMEETQRLTQTGMTIGTAGFLSPEQLLGLEVDGRSDIFSFGVLGYELVTYLTPFKADSISALFYAIAYVDPPQVEEVWPECPPALARCLARCLDKDRDTRYQDFSEVMDALRGVLAELETGGATGAAGIASVATGGAGASALGSGASTGSGLDTPTEAWGAAEEGREGGSGAGARVTAGSASAAAESASAAAVAASEGAEARRRRGKKILGGMGAVAFLVVAFEILRFAMPGGATSPAVSVPSDEGGITAESAEALVPSTEVMESSSLGEAQEQAAGGVASVPEEEAAGAALAPATPDGASPGAPSAQATPRETEVAAPPAGAPTSRSEPTAPATAGAAGAAQPQAPTVTQPQAPAPQLESPYRGTSTLVLLWSEGGDPTGAVTAENAFLEELSRRRMVVVEAGLLRGIHEDATAMTMARGLDANSVASLGRQHGAEVVVVGSLRTEWEPSVGQFFTGRAVLDLRAYSASSAELLRTATLRVGTGGTPGKLGPSPLAAETEAAREAGRMAAVEMARELGGMLPRR
jgi:eukaryotic-like serine/threonine-protein kinase